MRIKNGEQFLRLAIESHLPHLDEIVACHNGCTDRTVAILEALAKEHPGKIRIHAYAPEVHPPRSAWHDRTPTGSVHGLANYYNWALSKASFSHATKLDDDHLAIPGRLAAAVARVRRDIARGARRLHTFSGLNASVREDGELGVLANAPFSGDGDILFFPVSPRATFRQAPVCERFHFEGRAERVYLGLVYVHLKFAKTHLGLEYLDPLARRLEEEKHAATARWEAFERFRSPASVQALIRRVPRLRWFLRTHPAPAAVARLVTGRNPPLHLARLMRLERDLAEVDWRSVVEQVLGRPQERRERLRA
ncbi:MAG: glycosyltransferase family 2 protein [Anaeromyxobacter sp.]